MRSWIGTNGDGLCGKKGRSEKGGKGQNSRDHGQDIGDEEGQVVRVFTKRSWEGRENKK